MLHNSQDEFSSKTVQAQVAIIGGGMAGLALASKLSPHLSVLIVERGDVDLAPPGDEVSDEAISSGLAYPFGAIRDFRLGGSTSIWAGYCAEFDDFDFRPRDWVPMSGWPLERADLQPFSADAGKFLNLRSTNFQPDVVTKEALVPIPTRVDGLQVTAWRFGKPILRILEDRSFNDPDFTGLDIIANARALDIILTPDHSQVDHIRCRTRHAHEFTVKADAYIIATGGLESARLLLASQSQIAHGVANSSHLVGRCFCEHPHLVAQGFEFALEHPIEIWAEKIRDRDGFPFSLCAGLPERRQSELGVLNHRAHIFRTPQMELKDRPKLGLFLEQSPNPESRVSLDGELDDWGIPKLNLYWTMNDLDRHTFAVSANEIGAQLEAFGAGHITHEMRAMDVRDEDVLHSNHQLGTTRMSVDPELGPIDSNCRSHDLDNLYIAGGGVFPTVSWANPSFTMLLLTLRLAEHIKKRFCVEQRVT
jgi:choline dehydrogenase-like flavoprotein